MDIKKIYNIVMISAVLAAFCSPAFASDYRTNSYIYGGPAYPYQSTYSGGYRNYGHPEQERYYGNYPQGAPTYAAPYDNDAAYYYPPQPTGNYSYYYPDNQTGYYYYPEDNDAGYYYNYGSAEQYNGEPGYYYEDNDAYYTQYYQRQQVASDNDFYNAAPQNNNSRGDAQHYAADNTASQKAITRPLPMLFDD